MTRGRVVARHTRRNTCAFLFFRAVGAVVLPRKRDVVVQRNAELPLAVLDHRAHTRTIALVLCVRIARVSRLVRGQPLGRSLAVIPTTAPDVRGSGALGAARIRAALDRAQICVRRAALHGKARARGVATTAQTT